jgi:hypothetical protein
MFAHNQDETANRRAKSHSHLQDPLTALKQPVLEVVGQPTK